MIFAPAPKPRPFEESPRKLANIDRKQKRERDALPLLAPLIAEHQPSATQQLQSYGHRWHQTQHNRRHELAQVWKRARAAFYTLPPAARVATRHSWNTSPYPKSAYSFADFIHAIVTGKSTPEAQPWVIKAPVIFRDYRGGSFATLFKPVPLPARFDPAQPFASLPATFCGNLGHGILFLEVTPAPTSLHIMVKPMFEQIELARLKRLLAPLAPSATITALRFADPAQEAAFRAHRRHLKTMSDQAKTAKGPSA